MRRMLILLFNIIASLFNLFPIFAASVRTPQATPGRQCTITIMMERVNRKEPAWQEAMLAQNSWEAKAQETDAG